MCPKWNCMLAAVVLALAFVFLPVEVFEQTSSFAYDVMSCEASDHAGTIRNDRENVHFPDKGWTRQGVKINNTQRPMRGSARLSVFLHLFFMLSAILTADPFAGLFLLRKQAETLPKARFLWDLMARQKKDGKKWYPAAALGAD